VAGSSGKRPQAPDPSTTAPATAPADVAARDLETLHAAAAAAWPGVTLAPAAFATHVRERLPAAASPAEALAAMHASDLYLACACAGGDAPALAAFERAVIPQVKAALRRVGIPDALDDEVLQQLRVKLFTAAAARPPRILDYSGRGPLVAWVGISAVRLALNLIRAERPNDAAPPALVEPETLGPDPELDYLKTRYAAEVNAAFHGALRSLSSRARNLLRLHYGRGLSMDQIAGLYHVHRLTVLRWIDGAREALRRETRRALSRELRLRPEELESLMVLVESRVEVVLGDALSR
jgi:RNA polymerase sigma-70 factor (ECF subfamily)